MKTCKYNNYRQYCVRVCLQWIMHAKPGGFNGWFWSEAHANLYTYECKYIVMLIIPDWLKLILPLHSVI